VKTKLVPDTSVIIDGRISEILRREKGEIEVIIPDIVVSELENQANLGRETGFDGLDELNLLRKISKESNGRILIRFLESPRWKETRYKNDELIRRIAEENDATLVTSDRVQALVSETKGLKIQYIGSKVRRIQPRIFEFFDSRTMSVHLKENTEVFAKKGSVGHFKLVRIGTVIKREELEQYAKEIVEFARSDPNGCVELEQKGAIIVQLNEYRIVITRPPFSDGLEITAVKPLARMKLSEYNISDRLLQRLEKGAEGIFISGAPGAGKTTFAQALAEFYLSKGRIIKTMEQPRDLQLPDVVTQYSPLEGSMEKTSEILLLVRPDYTIFDELRKTHDFKVFADMRLAGVGMIGVTHANRAIDAIQRLVGRVELGMIPHVVDTVIFIDSGRIEEVYELRMVVKVPHGMKEADLARPVIEVIDFETKRPMYELYSYGEEVTLVPVNLGHVSEPERLRHIMKTKKLIILRSEKYRNENVQVFADNEYLFTARVNRAGNIKVKRNSKEGIALLESIKSGKTIRIENEG